MKKTFFMGVMGMFLLGSCSSHSGHNHEGHDRGARLVLFMKSVV